MRVISSGAHASSGLRSPEARTSSSVAVPFRCEVLDRRRPGGELPGGVDDTRCLAGVAQLRVTAGRRRPSACAAAPGVAVASRGTGGSCDRPPDATSRTLRVQGGEVATDRLAQQPDPLDRRERRRDRVDEDRHERLRPDVAVDDLHRLHRAVVDLHVQRHGQVDPLADHGLSQRPGDVLGNVEPSGLAAVVTDALRRRSRRRTAASAGRRSRCSGRARS